MAYNGSEYLLVALRREARFGFCQSTGEQTQRDDQRRDGRLAVVVARCLAVPQRWRTRNLWAQLTTGWENTLSFTPQLGAYDPNVNSLVEESVGAGKRDIQRALHKANAPVCLRPDAAEHANEVYNHSERLVPGQSDAVEPIVLERRAFSGQTECHLLLRERNQVRGHPGFVWRLRHQAGTFHSASRKFETHRLARFFCRLEQDGATRHQNKIATFRDDGEVQEVFTSTTVRTRDTVFPLFGGGGTKPATEAELQEFGESVRVRPDEAEGPSLALRHPDVEVEEAEGILAPGEEMQDDRGREQTDPEEL